MLVAIRVISALVGVGTAANVALGYMTNPAFVVPDYIGAAALLIAAAIPPRDLAWRALIAANGLAHGVFATALVSHHQTTTSPAYLLSGALLVTLLLMVVLVARGPQTATSPAA